MILYNISLHSVFKFKTCLTSSVRDPNESFKTCFTLVEIIEVTKSFLCMELEDYY